MPPPTAIVPSQPATCNLQPATFNLRPLSQFAWFAAVLCLCFCLPLYSLIRLAFHSELYSHALLIPFISFYLIWIRRSELLSPSGAGVPVASSPRLPASESPSLTLPPSPRPRLTLSSAIPLALGSALLTGYGLARWRGWQPAEEDYLCITILSFVLLLTAGGFVFLGARFMKSVAFPVAMLLFMAPFPTVVKSGIEMFFQHTSADVASILFSVSGTTFLREGLLFHLPGINIIVAEECSGIRSSLVLFITGLLAANLFLKTPWKRAALALFVIPLGIVRNGFRIFTIGMLCVHVDSSMIDSPIHHRGGPIFFLLSLVAFLLTLFLLRKSERNLEIR